MKQSLPAMRALKVLDLGVGLAAALTSKMLSDMGAEIWRVEPPGGDPFDGVYAFYRVWRGGAEQRDAAEIASLAAQADICIVGGEDYPGLALRRDAEALAARNPRLVVLDICGYLQRDAGPAVDILAQARTGFVYEHFADIPMHFSWPGPSYGAALLGVIASLAALIGRARHGRGDIARVSLQQGAAMWWSVFWMSTPNADAEFEQTITPKGVRQLIFRCADGAYVHFVTRAPGDLAKVYRILGIDVDVDPRATGMANLGAGAENYYGDTARYAEEVARFKRADLLKAFWDAGIAAESVLAPGECWDSEQTKVNGVIVSDRDDVRRVGAAIHTSTAVGVAPATPTLQHDQAPLTGLRIVDFGHLIAGPYASRLLADYGADVIKVEPVTGDMNRYRHRSHIAASVGKRSIGIDAKSPEGKAAMLRLCATAHAIHHNLRPGVAERLGLAPAALRDARPGVVTLETSAYGSVGPHALNAGYDMIMQAYCGLEMRNGGAEPAWCRAWIVDYATGALGAIAILAGLLEQAQSGASVEAQTNLLDSGIFLSSELFQQGGAWLGLEAEPHPAERLYQTADGWIAVAARTDGMARSLAQALRLEIGPRYQWAADAAKSIGAALRPLPTADALALLKAAGVWAERCVTDGWEALKREAPELTVTVDDRRYGALQCVGALAPLARGRRMPALVPAPALGEHTNEVLAEVDFTAEDMAGLRARGALR